ncbi:hypothetical protein K1719_030383 [Acacia pycnantha]|nr:hypothetical protein K1719_030383 [Acacia pycnantha]
MQDSIGIPACFSSAENDQVAVTRSGQSVFVSVYRTKIAHQCRFITITWCKNLLIHGLSVSVEGPEGETQYSCKVELKPWCFWRKHGSKRFMVDGKAVDVFWDLKAAKFNGETEPISEYYVAVVCDEEVVLLLGDLKNDAYKRTGCRPSLIDPILVSKKEHIFGKKKFSTRAKFHEKGRDGDKDRWAFGHSREAFTMEIQRERVNSSQQNEGGVSSSSSTPASTHTGGSGSVEGLTTLGGSSSEFCLFLYAWKAE